MSNSTQPLVDCNSHWSRREGYAVQATRESVKITGRQGDLQDLRMMLFIDASFYESTEEQNMKTKEEVEEIGKEELARTMLRVRHAIEGGPVEPEAVAEQSSAQTSPDSARISELIAENKELKETIGVVVRVLRATREATERIERLSNDLGNLIRTED